MSQTNVIHQTEFEATVHHLETVNREHPDESVLRHAFEILGIDPDAPAGTARHKIQAYQHMINVALPIFKSEAESAQHDYPHIPYISFKVIKDNEPK